MFHFLTQDLSGAEASDELVGPLPERDWLTGAPIEPPGPTTILLQRGPAGLPHYFDTTIPVMSGALLAILESAGGFDAYPVTLRRETGEEVSGYFAVNVTRLVDAADVEKSPHRLRFGKPRFLGPLVLSAARVGSAALFRLPHSPRLIVISESVAAAVREAQLPGVKVQATTDWRD